MNPIYQRPTALVVLRSKLIKQVSEGDFDKLAFGRNFCNDPSDTRGAGSNVEYHLKGVIGEFCTHSALGTQVLPEVLTGKTSKPDVTYTNPIIEAKCGLPYAFIATLRDDALYLVWKKIRNGIYMLDRMAMGYQIREVGEHPSEQQCWRKDKYGNATHLQNWVIPDLIKNTTVVVYLDMVEKILEGAKDAA